MKVELFRDRFVMLTRRKCKAQATRYALQEAAGLGHQDANTMCRGERVERWYSFLPRVPHRRIGGRIYTRLILHNERFHATMLTRPVREQTGGSGLEN